MSTSRTVWFEGPGVAAVRREPLGAPRPGEALVRLLCSGVSAGTERRVLLGQVPVEARAAMRLPSMRGDFDLPVAYGYAAVGVVEEAGPGGARGPSAGARVFALHPHQDRFVAAMASLRPLPAAVPPARLVLAANLETAVNVLWDAEVALGDRVLVAGLGVVGLLVGWLARAAGAVAVGADPEPARRELALALGLSAVAASVEAAEPDRADVLIDVSGSPAALASMVARAGVEARVVVGSWYGSLPATLALGGTFHPHRVTLRSSQVAAIAPHRRGRWSVERRWGLVQELLGEPALDRLVAPPVPFSEAPALYAELARGVVWTPPQRVLDPKS